MNDEFKKPTAEEMQKILHSPFDVRVHKQNFIGYLEVIIRSDGTVEYAVPSHTIKLASIYGKSMDQIYEEYATDKSGLDPVEWLCNKTGCISVWTEGYAGKANATQKRALWFLKYNEVYGGMIE
jgi:hypothetical protein